MAGLDYLKKALNIHTGNGDFMVDPSADPMGYKNLLGQAYDERVRQARASAPASPMSAFEDAREDAAMGPAGYNRDWAEFEQVPQTLAENTGKTFSTKMGGMGLDPNNYVDMTRPTQGIVYPQPGGAMTDPNAPAPGYQPSIVDMMKAHKQKKR